MPNIDHMRYKAVQELEKMGWKFIDNRWEAPASRSTELPTNDNQWKNAFIEAHSHWFKTGNTHQGSAVYFYLDQLRIKYKLVL